MIKAKINHPEREKGFNTGAYPQAVAGEGFLLVSGQASVIFEKSEFVRGSVEEATTLRLNNINSIIEAESATMDDVVKCMAHSTDINDFDRYNTVDATYFTAIKPARKTVQPVLAEELKLEIDCLVKLPTSHEQ
jgi:2-iminobutanoate/2-iminopropanoate deaminase